MKRTGRILLCTVTASLLGGCGVFAPISDAQFSAGEPVQTGQTVSRTTAETTAAPLSEAAVLAKAAAGTQTALPFTENFFQWLTEKTGQSALLGTLKTQIENGTYSDADWYTYTGMTVHVTNDLYTGAAEQAENIRLLDGDGESGISFTFAGDISFADNWHAMRYLKTTEHGITDCISPFLIDRMKAADISTINNEFSFSDRGTPMKGKMYTFRGSPENVSLYHTLGTDIVDLANNHVFDFGQDAFLDTLDTLKNAGIAYMGAGRNLAEASEPQYYIVEGKKIAYVAATRAEKNIMTPAAGEQSPGVLRCYDPTAFLAVIREAKANADYVIANIHWGTENSHDLEPVQTQTAYQYIDAGADLIIGAHAHCLQGIEFYRHKPIIYNLGNFWFSEYDIDTGLLGATLAEDGGVSLVFYPATQRNCRTTYVGGEAEGDRILQCMRDYSINAEIAADGTVSERP